MTDTQLLGTAAAHSARGPRGRGGGPGLSWGKADPTAAGCGQKPGGCCEAFPQPPRSGHTKCRLRVARDKGDPGRLEGGPGPAQGWGLRTEDSQGERRSRAPGRKTRACPGLREGDPPGPAAVPARSPSLWAWHLLLICPRPHTPGNQTLPFLWDWRRRWRGGGGRSSHCLSCLPLCPTAPHMPTLGLGLRHPGCAQAGSVGLEPGVHHPSPELLKGSCRPASGTSRPQEALTCCVNPLILKKTHRRPQGLKGMKAQSTVELI